MPLTDRLSPLANDRLGHLARLCSQSYRRQPACAAYELCETVHYGTDDATVFWRPGRLVVAVRGTELADGRGLARFREWLYNIAFRPVHWGLCDVHVHRGFLAHFRGLWDRVMNTRPYEQHIMGDDAVIFAGHSRGGAIAQLAALYEPAGLVVTFGSPRVGGRSFRERCREQGVPHLRVTNGLDVVPCLPPPLWYRHYGEHYRASWTGTHQVGHYVDALS